MRIWLMVYRLYKFWDKPKSYRSTRGKFIIDLKYLLASSDEMLRQQESKNTSS